MRLHVFAAALLALAFPMLACAQSSPSLTTGQIPTAAQWNSYFSNKQDYSLNSGAIYLGNGSNLPAQVVPSGDCTFSSAGVVTCAKTGGVPFGSAATYNVGTSGATVPVLSNGNVFSNANSFAYSTSAGLSTPLRLSNSAADNVADSAALTLTPWSGGCAAQVRANRDAAGANYTGIDLQTCENGVLNHTITMGANGSIQMSHIGQGVLEVDGSHNVTASHSIGVNGSDICVLNTTCTWTAYQLLNMAAGSVSSTPGPKEGVGLQLIGNYQGADSPGENDLVDAFAINGFAQMIVERYNWNGTNFTQVKSGDLIGGFGGAALINTPGTSDPYDAGLAFVATEDQATGHNGMSACLDYTPNASTALNFGLCVSPQGNGGVTVVGNNGVGSHYSTPTDLGPGTLNVSSSIMTGNHLRADGAKPTVPSVSCGGGTATITGTDVAGRITTPGPVTSCEVDFAQAFAAIPVCIAQNYSNTAALITMNGLNTASFRAEWASSFNGTFQFICIGQG